MELFDYIEAFYNQRRRHSTLGQYQSGRVRTSEADVGSIVNPSTKLDQRQERS